MQFEGAVIHGAHPIQIQLRKSMPNPQVQSIEVDIKTWDELHSWILGALKTWWLFRGQAEYRWNLSPKIARNYNKLRSPTLVPIAFESSLLGIFKRQVRTILDIVPDDSDILGWLALMQHYGAPTRLLDWTYSPYIALYFAIESLDETKDESAWVSWRLPNLEISRHLGLI